MGKIVRKQKWAVANGRFCEMTAVTPQIGTCLITSFYPAASSVEAATSQSRAPLAASVGQCSGNIKNNKGIGKIM
jgi:hypothetical protein